MDKDIARDIMRYADAAMKKYRRYGTKRLTAEMNALDVKNPYAAEVHRRIEWELYDRRRAEQEAKQ